jgi:hypothetical protein
MSSTMLFDPEISLRWQNPLLDIIVKRSQTPNRSRGKQKLGCVFLSKEKKLVLCGGREPV